MNVEWKEQASSGVGKTDTFETPRGKLQGNSWTESSGSDALHIGGSVTRGTESNLNSSSCTTRSLPSEVGTLPHFWFPLQECRVLRGCKVKLPLSYCLHLCICEHQPQSPWTGRQHGVSCEDPQRKNPLLDSIVFSNKKELPRPETRLDWCSLCSMAPTSLGSETWVKKRRGCPPSSLWI